MIAILCTATVSAAEDITEKSGTITVSLKDDEQQGIEGVCFYCRKIAGIRNDEYIYEPEFEHINVDLNDMKNSEEIKKIMDRLAKVNKKEGIKIYTDKTGTAACGNLEPGVYLICAEESSTDLLIEKSLVTIPVFSESEGRMIYEQEIIPKYSSAEDAHNSLIPLTGINDSIEYYLAAALAGVFIIFILIRIKSKKKES